MASRRQPPIDHPATVPDPGPQARGLYAAGWYAMRDEGRIVHPAEQTEQTVSPEVWRALRELGAGVPAPVLTQQD